MKVGIYSLYWDNVDPAIVASQALVFRALEVGHYQHRIQGMDHGEWIDWVIQRNTDTDAFLFLDVDCVPLSSEAVATTFNKALSGVLFGCHAAANHIDPSRSYAGAWYVCINRAQWEQAGRPSARGTPYGDVCQLWTDTWRQRRAQVDLVDPTACSVPKWNLPGLPMSFGAGTRYGNLCYHLFESRGGQYTSMFVDVCKRIAEGSLTQA